MHSSEKVPEFFFEAEMTERGYDLADGEGGGCLRKIDDDGKVEVADPGDLHRAEVRLADHWAEH